MKKNKAFKLGFTSLYNYFEEKILREKKVIEDKKKKFEELKTNNDLNSKENKSCSCC